MLISCVAVFVETTCVFLRLFELFVEEPRFSLGVCRFSLGLCGFSFGFVSFPSDVVGSATVVIRFPQVLQVPFKFLRVLLDVSRFPLRFWRLPLTHYRFSFGFVSFRKSKPSVATTYANPGSLSFKR